MILANDVSYPGRWRTDTVLRSFVTGTRTVLRSSSVDDVCKRQVLTAMLGCGVLPR